MIKIGLAQLNSNDDVNQNLKQIVELVESAVEAQPDLIVFPENSLFFRIDPKATVAGLALDDSVFKKLESLAAQTKIALHLTTAIKDENQKVYNSSVLIRPGERVEILYRKIHLFDIALKDQKPIRESDSFVGGEKENIFELKGFKFGSSICYDIRFSELYLKYARHEVDALLIPAAFLVKTGLDHWEVLLRARAIESQCYVLAPAQSGKHIGSIDSTLFRETFGHTLAIDPWGKILAERESLTGLTYVEIRKSEIQFVRQQIPMKNHRRL
jgi:deaminated glutathione amidase